MTTLVCPDCGVKVQQEDLICFRCGANLPHPSGPDEDLPTPTISQQFISPDDARRHGTGNISTIVLRIAFPTGNVEVPAGTSVLLGRDPAESLVAAAFARFDNVSRRHATIKVDDSGHATIRDENSTNGTFVNNDRVLPGADVRLVDGDQIRLAADVTGSVSIPNTDPDPSAYTRNGTA
jgi:pSer/pThr/pTyr-binding forkhead associated (FHA) protein